MKRRHLIVILVLVLGLLLAACEVAPETPDEPTDEPATEEPTAEPTEEPAEEPAPEVPAAPIVGTAIAIADVGDVDLDGTSDTVVVTRDGGRRPVVSTVSGATGAVDAGGPQR